MREETMVQFKPKYFKPKYCLFFGKDVEFLLEGVKFYINWALKRKVIHISSNEIPSQNQLKIGGVAYKLYIHTQVLEFYQCGTNLTFIFQYIYI